MGSYLTSIENLIWDSVGVPLLICLGLYFSWQLGFFQILKFPKIFSMFHRLYQQDKAGQGNGAVSPVKAFFASVGGCIGIGNIASICSAVKIGGPGALFWVWVTGLLGMVVKYSEVYLGMATRVKEEDGSYSGGPMYFLKKAFNSKILCYLAAFLLCIYGVEIYMFKVVLSSISSNYGVDETVLLPFLLGAILITGIGGIKWVGEISGKIIPVFVLLFLGMGLWIIFQNLGMIPTIIADVFKSAFVGKAPIGGFVGSSFWVCLSQGVRRGCYTGDLGIGYASVIYSESTAENKSQQGSMSVLGIFLDTFIICTFSILIILVTGTWKAPIDSAQMVQKALELYFPYVQFYMPIFIFLLGYSTMIAFFCVGIKASKFIHPKFGPLVYYVYALSAFTLFSFVESDEALSVMALSGGLLLLMNSCALIKLRKEVKKPEL